MTATLLHGAIVADENTAAQRDILIVNGKVRDVAAGLKDRADVDEQEAWRVKKGAGAVASVRGDSSHRYNLHFVRFEPYVIPKKNLTGDSTERVDTRVLQVIFALEKNAPVFAGQQMDVFIDGGIQQ